MGQEVRFTIALKLLEGEETQYVIADQGYITQTFFDKIKKMGAEAVIANKVNQKIKRTYDQHLYKERNLVERLFNKMKQFRRIATPFDKALIHYKGFVSLYYFYK